MEGLHLVSLLITQLFLRALTDVEKLVLTVRLSVAAREPIYTLGQSQIFPSHFKNF